MYEKQPIIARLNELIDEFSSGRWTVFAKFVGAGTNTVNQWLDGRALPGAELTIRICEKCGVTPNWLLLGWAPKYGTEQSRSVRIVAADAAGEAAAEDFVTIPIINRLAMRDAARGVLVVDEKTRGGVTLVRRDLAAQPFAFVVADEAMLPEAGEGDLVVFDRAARDGDGLAVLDLAGVVTLRRVVGGTAHSNQPARFPPAKVKPRDVLGRVVEVRRTVKE